MMLKKAGLNSGQCRPLKVACIGAGFSGIYLALRLQQQCENVELVIYEKVGSLPVVLRDA